VLGFPSSKETRELTQYLPKDTYRRLSKGGISMKRREMVRRIFAIALVSLVIGATVSGIGAIPPLSDVPEIAADSSVAQMQEAIEVESSDGLGELGTVIPATTLANLSVPYIRQVGDTSDYFDGRCACGATSAVMIAASYGRLPSHPMTCTFCTPTHTSYYGWYVGPYSGSTPTSYSRYGFTFDVKFTGSSGCQIDPVGGAYGYIHYNDNYAKPYYARNYFWKHGLFSEVIFSPSEATVKSEIDEGHPVWASTTFYGGHIVVIKGYSGTNYYVNDPWPYGYDYCYMGNDMLYSWSQMGVGSKWIVTTDPITVGDRVTTLDDGIKVRNGPGIRFDYAAPERNAGDTGTIVSDSTYGPFYNSDDASRTDYHTWIKVRWDSDGETGWSAIGYGYTALGGTSDSDVWIEKIPGTAQPDLVVEDIWVEPSEFAPGDTVELWQRTRNVGSGDAVGTFWIQRYFDGSPISGIDKNGLAAGASYESYYPYTWPLDCSSHTVSVVADLYNVISESNEGNNQRSESFSAVCIPQIELAPSGYSFGDIEVSQCSGTYSFTLQNTGSGTATGTVSLTGTHASQFQIISGGGSFSLGAGATKTISVRFCPTSIGGKSASLFADGSNCNDDSSSLSGTGFEAPEIELTPLSYDFGSIEVGQCSGTHSFILQNVGGGTATGTVSLTGTHASQFQIISGGGSFSLGAGATKTISVRFCPTSTGTKTATLFADGSNCNDDSSSLTGTGFEGPQIELTPSSYSFGDIQVGQCSGTHSFTLQNIGGGTATGSVSLTGAYADQFQVTSGGGSFSLGAGATKTINVRFCPTSTGFKTASLFADGSNCNDDTSSLSGTGFRAEGVNASVQPAIETVGVGEVFELIIQAEAEDQLVSGIDAFVNFDPAYLEVVDADTGTPGIQIIPGSALPTVIVNEADNSIGTIDFSAGKLGAPFPTGTFTVATIEFRALAPTRPSTALTFSTTPPRETRVDYAGNDVTGTLTGGSVTITVDAPIFLDPASSEEICIGQIFTLEIKTNVDNEQQVSGVQAFVDFDPTYLKCLSVTSGASLPTVLQNTCDNTAGTIDYSAGKLGAPFPTGGFTVATIEFKALAETSGTAVTFSFTGSRKTTVDLGGSPIPGIHGDATVEIIPGAIVDVSVVLQGGSRPPESWEVPITIQFFSLGADVMTDTPIYEFNLTTTKSDGSATCQCLGVMPGTYDITAQAWNCPECEEGNCTLMNVGRSVVISAPSTAVDMGTLLAGDADCNGIINISDFGILAVAYMCTIGEPCYDCRADFDCNGIINISDFGLLAVNYMQMSPIDIS
jgi:hypothetical protein